MEPVEKKKYPAWKTEQTVEKRLYAAGKQQGKEKAFPGRLFLLPAGSCFPPKKIPAILREMASMKKHAGKWPGKRLPYVSWRGEA